MSLTIEQQNVLNNFRAILNRQLRPTSTVDASLVADLILHYAPLMREAGLGPELLQYLEYMQYRFPEKSLYHTRLMVEMATTKDDTESHSLFQQAIEHYRMFDLEMIRAEYARAYLAYGRYLLHRSYLADAEKHYQVSMDLLAHGNYPLELGLTNHEMGHALLERGHFEAALEYFERALETLSNADHAHYRAKTQTDYATVLIQLGELDRAESVLDSALSTCQSLNLWSLRGQVRCAMAYIDQTRAEMDSGQKKAHFERAEKRLLQAIADSLPMRNTRDLATLYHDLGRLQARLHKFDDAETHVRMSSEMFARIGNRRSFAVAQITLGQILLLKNGDATAAVERIRQALAIASELGDTFTQKQAAESLVRIHQIQVKRADENTIQNILSQIAHTRKRFEILYLSEFTSTLDSIITELEN